MFTSPLPMHIPDGFLSVAVSLVLWIVSIAVIGYALKRISNELQERQIPLMGILAAAIFAGQMLNFSVTGGTSGHLLGAAIATIIVGPWSAIVVMTAVVGIQAVVFQDGGLLVLGANLFNMAIVGVAVSYFVYLTVSRVAGKRSWAVVVSGFITGWFSIFIASLACGLQLALSGTSPANIALPSMAGIHALIGIGEGLITGGALAFITTAKRDLLSSQDSAAPVSKSVWIGGMVIAVLLVVISPIASAHPDGLEWVAEQEGFLDLAREPVYNIIPDYVVPGISNEAVATIAAGFAGVFLVIGAMLLVSQLRNRRQAE